MSHYKPYPVYKDSGVKWLGRVPEHWDTQRIKTLIDSARNGIWGDDPDGGSDDIPCARVADFDRISFTVKGDLPTLRKVPEAQRLSRQVNYGDLLIEKSGGGEQTTVGVVVQYLGAKPVICSNFVAVVKPKKGVLPRWLCYTYAHLYSAGVNVRSIKQTTGIQNIDSDDYFSERVAVPPEIECQAISNHLDRETTRIDALIEKKRRFVELLCEKRQALITRAVTKGLDPKVKMKDSGVEWLGEVPEHWCVKQLKHVVDPNTSITYGIVQAGPEYEGGVPYIRTSDMSGDELPVNGYPLTSPEIDASYARSRVRPGDIVMSIRASVGKCLPVPDELSLANLTQGTAKISPGQKVTRAFLLAFLNSGAAQVYFDLMAKGATFKEITLDALRRTPVLMPPRDEQVVIDRFIALHVGRLDRLVRASECSVEMLKERRSALITAAITGQIDLREVVV